MAEDNFLSAHGVNRRDFMKLCAGMAATLGLSSNAAAEMAAAITNPQRPPVIWIGAQECTGCTESLLRATHPTIENLILNTISLEYHEVLSAAFGHQAEENKHNAMKRYKGKYVLVVDGSIPLKDGGVYCMVAGEPIVDHIRRAAADAAAVIAIGSCAAWGGVPATGGNPTGAVSLEEAIGKPVINIPGCPPNPHNFLTTVVYYITYGKLPELDSKHRPLFAYERLIHENCERRPHFDAGRFAKEFGDYGHRQGWCLYHLGCKGPETYGNCSTLEFCDIGGGIWPVGIGHPCYGCNEQGIGFTKGIFQLANVENPTPRVDKPGVANREGGHISPTATGLIGGALGILIGVSLMTVRELGRQQKRHESERQNAEKSHAEHHDSRGE
ncbi:MAG: hydrogenase 2 small subunit [Enterobacterales bacterium]|uniref:hydrogenase (acceptor) n=2 Tax=Obesumbacterium proteus TaxID=82983 RepID=A0AA91INQ5_9GAMM|nr:hydrogenase 2 small subunit [Obesumbacterium proteus]MDN5988318.1 hydrogenase 2 small subunit [Hafniaceae bacterium]MDN6089883.1 hydrogenase 2 small subunit [Enterobacterales bacterium]AMO82750.1 hydrogenase 2 small subunit [Obesumbacterium proteus]KKI43730.1 hydrogenase 2 small subunit [Obesumbacterium proteus]MCE9884463.1 hydrogenase 2 small subunit [Obesumbacterium proteus]